MIYIEARGSNSSGFFCYLTFLEILFFVKPNNILINDRIQIIVLIVK